MGGSEGWVGTGVPGFHTKLCRVVGIQAVR